MRRLGGGGLCECMCTCVCAGRGEFILISTVDLFYE